MAIADDSLEFEHVLPLPEVDDFLQCEGIKPLNGSQEGMIRLLHAKAGTELARREIIVAGTGLKPELYRDFLHLVRRVQDSRLGVFLHDEGERGGKRYWFGVSAAIQAGYAIEDGVATFEDSIETDELVSEGFSYDASFSWRPRARCRSIDPDVFFPEDTEGVKNAKKICAECSVTELCLGFALQNRIDKGIWGGASERSRRRILKERAARAATKSDN